MVSSAALFDELEKIALSSKKQSDSRKSTKHKLLKNTGILTGVGMPVGLAGGIGALALSSSAMNDTRGIQAGPALLETENRLKAVMKPDMNIVHGAVSPFYAPPTPKFLSKYPAIDNIIKNVYAARMEEVPSDYKKGFVGARSKELPGFLAHELGHARTIGKPILSGLWRGYGTLGQIAKPISLLSAAYGDPEGTASKISPYVAAASTLPTLLAEGAASISGLRGMRRAGFSAVERSLAARQLGKAFGSYLSHEAPAVAAPVLIRAIRKHQDSKI